MKNTALRIFSICAILALSIAVPASAYCNKSHSTVTVYNYSRSCAWVTAYWSYKSEAHWRISAARWVGPNGETRFSETFNNPALGPQWRIRAEVRSKDNGACRGRGGDPDISTQFNLYQGQTGNGLTGVSCKCSATVRINFAGYTGHDYKIYHNVGPCTF